MSTTAIKTIRGHCLWTNERWGIVETRHYANGNVRYFSYNDILDRWYPLLKGRVEYLKSVGQWSE